MTPNVRLTVRRAVRSPSVAAILALAAAVGPAPLAAAEIRALESARLHGAWLVPSESPRTTLTLVVLAGERDNPGEHGLAHYAEHLVWLSAVDARAAGGGRHANASTGPALTSYRLDGPREELDDMLATLARVFEPIDLPAPFMREEVGIVQREYDLRARESPRRALEDELARLQHGERWPARSVLGTPESIARLTPAAAAAWQARTHRPDNTVLLVHGDHEPEALEASLRRVFGTKAAEAGSVTEAGIARSASVATGVAARREGAAGPATRTGTGTTGTDASETMSSGDGSPAYRMPPPAREVHERVESRVDEPWLLHSRLARLDADADPLRLEARFDLLWSVLDSTRAGGLAGPLRYDDFVARGFDLSLFAVDARHVELSLVARPDRGVSVRTLFERFEAALLESARDGVPPDTYERVRTRLLDDFDESESREEQLLGLAFRLLARRQDPVPLSDYRARLTEVTLDDVNALLDAIAAAPRTVTLLVEPGERR